MRKKLILLGSIFILVLAVAAWFLYEPLLLRYRVRQLAAGDSAAADALERTLSRWPAADPRRAQLLARLADRFADFAPPGQLGVLRLAETAGPSDESPRLVQAGLNAADDAVRDRAILLALKPEFALGPAVAALLKDERADVRRAALEALGSAREIVGDEDLLPLLHDPDADVRGLCEAALLGRGLSDKDLLLGRLVTDPSPLKRLEVIRHLPANADLDPQEWLNKLTRDPSPLVRATAARMAFDPDVRDTVDLTERVRQMARDDPDGTVRQIAAFLIR